MSNTEFKSSQKDRSDDSAADSSPADIPTSSFVGTNAAGLADQNLTLPPMPPNPDVLLVSPSGGPSSAKDIKLAKLDDLLELAKDILKSLEYSPTSRWVTLSLPGEIRKMDESTGKTVVVREKVSYTDAMIALNAYYVLSDLPHKWIRPGPEDPPTPIDPTFLQMQQKNNKTVPVLQVKHLDPTKPTKISVYLAVPGSKGKSHSEQRKYLQSLGLKFADPRELALVTGACDCKGIDPEALIGKAQLSCAVPSAELGLDYFGVCRWTVGENVGNPEIFACGSPDNKSLLHDELEEAIDKEDITKVQLTLDQGADPACRGGRALVWAAQKKFLPAVWSLLEKAEQLAKQGQDRPLEILRHQFGPALRAYMKAGGEDSLIITRLIENGLDLSRAMKKDRLWPLLRDSNTSVREEILRFTGPFSIDLSACEGGAISHLHIIARLIQKGAVVDGFQDGVFQAVSTDSVLSEQGCLEFLGAISGYEAKAFRLGDLVISALRNGHLRVVEKLIEISQSSSADHTNWRTRIDLTRVLKTAIECGPLEAVNFFLERPGITLDSGILKAAIQRKDSDVLKSVMAKYAFLLTDEDLTHAIETGIPEIVTTIYEAGQLKIDHRHLRQATKQRDVTMYTHLLRTGSITPNQDDLKSVIELGSTDLCELFIEKGCQLDATHLLSAVGLGDREMVDFLLRKGLTLNAHQLLFGLRDIYIQPAIDISNKKQVLSAVISRGLDSVDAELQREIAKAHEIGFLNLLDCLLRNTSNGEPRGLIQLPKVVDYFICLLLQNVHIETFKELANRCAQEENPSKELLDVWKKYLRPVGPWGRPLKHSSLTSIEAGLLDSSTPQMRREILKVTQDTVAALQARVAPTQAPTRPAEQKPETGATGASQESTLEEILESVELTKSDLNARCISALQYSPKNNHFRCIDQLRDVSGAIASAVCKDLDLNNDELRETFSKDMLRATIRQLSDRCEKKDFKPAPTIQELIKGSEIIPYELADIIRRVAADVFIAPLVSGPFCEWLPGLDDTQIRLLEKEARVRALAHLTRSPSLDNLREITNFLSNPIKIAPLKTCRPLLAKTRWEPLFRAPVELSDGYSVVALASVDELLDLGGEGQLNNCVGKDPRYASLCVEGSHHILAIKQAGAYKALFMLEAKSVQESAEAAFECGRYRKWGWIRFEGANHERLRPEEPRHAGLFGALYQFVSKARSGEVPFNDRAAPVAESREQTRLSDVAVTCPFERITGLPLNEPDLVWRLREHYSDEINLKWKDPGSMRVPAHSLRLQGKDLVDFDHLSNGSWAWEMFKTFVYQDNGS